MNPQGCAARFHRPLEIGGPVRLEDLPAGISVTAQVVNCIPIEKFWPLEVALDEPANVWGGDRYADEFWPVGIGIDQVSAVITIRTVGYQQGSAHLN